MGMYSSRVCHAEDDDDDGAAAVAATAATAAAAALLRDDGGNDDDDDDDDVAVAAARAPPVLARKSCSNGDGPLAEPSWERRSSEVCTRLSESTSSCTVARTHGAG